MKNTIKGNFVGFTNGDATITNSKDMIKAMTNNKQQTAVDWFAQQVLDNWNDIHAGARDIIEFLNKAEEMEVAGKEMSYADGYAEGYKRALDYMTMSIKNAIETK